MQQFTAYIHNAIMALFCLATGLFLYTAPTVQAQAPKISYPVGSKVFAVGSAITPLTPTNTGGAVIGNGQVTVSTLAGSGIVGSADGVGNVASFYWPTGITVDSFGNVYVADMQNNKIRKISTSGLVNTLAGSGSYGSANGTGTSASFKGPSGVAIDGFGNIYIADTYNQKIRKISPSGIVSTFAGSGSNGSSDGTSSSASFDGVRGIAIDSIGNLYVADMYNHKIRKINPSGVVSTLAGSGLAGSSDVAGASASFTNPTGVAVDGSGNVYVSDQGNHKIRKVSPTGIVSTLAGSGLAGNSDGEGAEASFNMPTGLTIDASGNLYVADAYNNNIRKVTPSGIVSTVAGNGTVGSVDGVGAAAKFNYPNGIAIDRAGYLYVADLANQKIRKIGPAYGFSISPALPAGLKLDPSTGIISGTPTTGILPTNYVITAINMSGSSSYTINIAVSAAPTINLFAPTLGGTGSIVTIRGNNLTGATAISFGGKAASSFEVINDSTITTVVGSGNSGSVMVTTNSGKGSLAGFNYLAAPNISYAGGNKVFIAGQAITPIAPTNTGGAITGNGLANVSTLAGTGSIGSADGVGTWASFYHPFDVAVDGFGNVYVADAGNNKIRKISPTGFVSTLAGSGNVDSNDGSGSAASFSSPQGIAVDASGNVYVGDYWSYKIRKVSPRGIVSTLAGTGIVGKADGAAIDASFDRPSGLTIDASGNVYVADFGNNKIRKVSTTGVVSTFAGNGNQGDLDTLGVAASFNAPSNVDIDASGNVYVADMQNGKIRKISPTGLVSTLAGNNMGINGDGIGSAASFGITFGVAVDTSGNVYVADYGNNKIRKVSPIGVVNTIAGNGSWSSIDSTGTDASFKSPVAVAVASNGYIYVADSWNHKIRKISPAFGYSISPALPAGLSFNGSTGIISGTPKKAIPASNYVVTAINAGGSSSFTINIAILQTVAPNISYTGGNKVFTVGKLITPISPSNTGGTVTGIGQVTVSTFAGSGSSGSSDNIGTLASFNAPYDVALDGLGNLYVADMGNNNIRKISPSGVVSTLAGKGSQGSKDSIGTLASFDGPSSVSVDDSGNVYVADLRNHTIRKINSTGLVTTLAGCRTIGIGNGIGKAACFYFPFGVAVDGNGNVTVADTYNHKIRRISPSGLVNDFVGSGIYGSGFGSNDGIGNSTSFYFPSGLAVDGLGNVYVADYNNHKIRKISPLGVVSTLAGSGNPDSTDGVGASASFNYPSDVAVDGLGNVYVADTYNQKIRKITPSGLVSTLAGNGSQGSDDGIGLSASFNFPNGLAVDSIGNVYVADRSNSKIRKISSTYGYSVSPALPAGLIINGNTGIITGTPSVVTSATNYVITASNSGGSSSYTLNIATVITTPVTLTTLTAKPTEAKEVILNWQTATETNSSHFIIERSTDGKEFNSIGKVTAIGSGSNAYHFTDSKPIMGKVVYYRLKMMDKDGSYEYSKAVSVSLTTTHAQLITISPNPAKDKVRITIQINKPENGVLQIINTAGKVVKQQKVSLREGTNQINLPINSLAKGNYIVSLKTESNQYQERLIKE